VIPNYNFDRSLSAVIDLVMERATERAAPRHGLEEASRVNPVAGNEVAAPAGAVGATEGGIT
jgi:hypothetical protein